MCVVESLVETTYILTKNILHDKRFFGNLLQFFQFVFLEDVCE